MVHYITSVATVELQRLRRLHFTAPTRLGCVDKMGCHFSAKVSLLLLNDALSVIRSRTVAFKLRHEARQ